MITDKQDLTLIDSDSDPVFDTGSTAHMWNHLAHFTKYAINTDPEYTTKQADGSVMQIIGIGEIGCLKMYCMYHD